ncbi:hypothetical protein F2Q68_00024966 [Brassica cretica]|uniref:Uncharacterized protein n=2 Tax=Brassica cretica TaxID=69181 RepID=A0A8S9IBK7_BRACR|nr:hypothetical protein F2Q68_00024966 [Brassica cretica]KAF3576300.1 hypothetical protein DY000_02030296 [Brassica cretica]
MTDPCYSEMKQHRREYYWLYAVADANQGIPNKCACGQSIVVETGEQGMRYYVCKVFEVRMMCDDGSHFRICCLQALEDEVNDLKKDARDEVQTRLKLQLKIQQMSKEIEELKKLVKGFS